MNRDTLIRQLTAADEYAPEHDLPETARTSTVALAEIRRRIDMDTRESTRTTNQEQKRRPGWIVAIAVAAAVVAIVAVLAVIGTTRGDGAPASPPTTEAAPPSSTVPTTAAAADGELTADEAELVTGLVEAFNGIEYERWPADVSAFLGYFESGAEIRTGMTSGSDEGEGGTVEEFWTELQFRSAMHSRWDVVGCRTESGAILCQVDFTHDAPASHGEPLRVGLRLVVEDGLVTSLALSAPASSVSQAVPQFYEWVAENHPEDLDLMRGPGSVGVPIADPVSIDLWRTYLPEYYASIDSQPAGDS